MLPVSSGADSAQNFVPSPFSNWIKLNNKVTSQSNSSMHTKCAAVTISFLEVDSGTQPTFVTFVSTKCQEMLIRIMVLPVTSCEAERSFSDLCRIKTYLRSTIKEDAWSLPSTQDTDQSHHGLLPQPPGTDLHCGRSDRAHQLNLQIPTSRHLCPIPVCVMPGLCSKTGLT